MQMSSIGKKLRRNFQDYGLVPTLGKCGLQLLSPVYLSRTFRIYRKNLREPLAEVRCDQGLRFAEVGLDEGQLLGQIERMEEWLEGRLQELLREGAYCLVLLEGDRLAGFNLVSFREMHMPLVKVRRRLRPFEAWSEQITVGKDFRGKGVATSLRRKMFQNLTARGIRKLYGGTLSSNKANLGLCRKIGLREIADVRFRRIMRSARWRVTRVRTH